MGYLTFDTLLKNWWLSNFLCVKKLIQGTEKLVFSFVSSQKIEAFPA